MSMTTDQGQEGYDIGYKEGYRDAQGIGEPSEDAVDPEFEERRKKALDDRWDEGYEEGRRFAMKELTKFIHKIHSATQRSSDAGQALFLIGTLCGQEPKEEKDGS